MRRDLRGDPQRRPEAPPLRRLSEMAHQPRSQPEEVPPRTEAILLQPQVVLHVPREERQTVDHDDVLQPRTLQRSLFDPRQSATGSGNTTFFTFTVHAQVWV